MGYLIKMASDMLEEVGEELDVDEDLNNFQYDDDILLIGVAKKPSLFIGHGRFHIPALIVAAMFPL